jgi:1-acyl-sn-glycerol-3-phosphate acyltransferase
MKSSVRNNLFLGAGARLARYIANDPPRRMITRAVAELGRGAMVLLFPEGTRTREAPVNALQATVGIIAKHAGVPVQTLLIEQDTAYLSKGWGLFRPVSLPITYRVRLGRRFDPPDDVRAFTLELERYFRTELAHSVQNHWIAERGAAASSTNARAARD